METVTKKIEQILAENPVIVFMKGDKFLPQCGFSARVVDILDSTGVNYTSYDILEDPEMRQALKEYSSWPTYPQLYVNGELIGGCDIISEMAQNGELSDLFANLK